MNRRSFLGWSSTLVAATCGGAALANGLPMPGPVPGGTQPPNGAAGNGSAYSDILGTVTYKGADGQPAPDTGARVALVSASMDQVNAEGLEKAMADATHKAVADDHGRYRLPSVYTGYYTMLMVSNHLTGEAGQYHENVYLSEYDRERTVDHTF